MPSCQVCQEESSVQADHGVLSLLLLNPGREFLCEFLISKEDHDSSLQKALKFAKRALRECQETLKELGPWAANKVAGCLIKDLAGIWSSVCN